MSAPGARPWTAVASVALILGGAWLFYTLARRASRGGEQAPLYSLKRYDPYGTAALYELLHERGVDVRAWQRSRPAPESRGTLIQVLGAAQAEDGTPRLEPQHLRDWIAAGNTVIQFCAEPDALPEGGPDTTPGWVVDGDWVHLERGMRSGHAPGGLEWQRHTASWLVPPSEIAAGAAAVLPPLVLHSPSGMPAGQDAGWRALARAGGRVVVAERHLGAGRLIAVSSPTPLLNSTLAEGGNLAFILAVIGEGPAWLDEWSHGIGHGGTVLALIARLGLLPMMAQIVFILVLFTWSTWGHPRVEWPSAPRQRSSVEQVLTLGYLYGHVLGPTEVLERARHEARRRLAGALKCSAPRIEKRLTSLAPALADKGRRVLEALSPEPGQPALCCPQCGRAVADHSAAACPDCGAALSSREPDTPPEAAPRCPRCGYSLQGNTTGACPECGARVSPQTLRDSRVARRRQERSDRRYRAQVEADAARLLTLSHDFARELTREHHA